MEKNKRYKQLNREKRIKIEALHEAGFTPKEIAKQIGVHFTTIYRELKRGKTIQRNSDWTEREIYSSDKGQIIYEENKKNCGRSLKIGNDYEFLNFVEDKIINDRYSPAAVLGYIKENKLTFKTEICLTTLYNYIKGDVFLNVTMENCPERKTGKKAKHPNRKVQKRIQRGTSISERPEYINNKEEVGHWEMDTVVGAQGKGKAALLVLTERKTDEEIVEKMNEHTMKEVVRILDKIERKLGAKGFREKFKSITVDNGAEFSDCAGMERSRRNKKIPRTKVYYCHPYSSWERASNENQNKLIRRWCPKGTVFDDISRNEVARIEKWINNYPRGMFDWKNSEYMYQQELLGRVAM